jgi:hypothetical protein
MKKAIITFIAVLATGLLAAAPRRAALIVQNHTSEANLPMAALADTLVASLSGPTLRVVNPASMIGRQQNRTAAGEKMPEMSAAQLGSILGVDGVVTASVQEFTSQAIGAPRPRAYSLKTRITISLADCATGQTVCGTGGQVFSKNISAERLSLDNAVLYEELLHDAAANYAKQFLAALDQAAWEPTPVNRITVYFGCNVLGADVQIDGLAYGMCPGQYSVTPGVHTVQVSYPPYYLDYRREVLFNADGQTFAVVLQLNPEGEKARRSGELFKKQLTLFDAELERYQKTGETEDYIRKTIADGVSLYWKNSCSRIVITDGKAETIDFATPKVDGGTLQKGPSSSEVGAKLRELLKMD